MIKHLLYAAPLLPIFLSSVAYQAEPLTEYFIVDFKQNTVFSNPGFSIEPAPHSLSGRPSVVADTNSCAGSDSPPGDKPHRSRGYSVKKPMIESISWQLLYATDLLVGYKLILTCKEASRSSTPHSSLPEAVVAIGSLLRRYWYLDSSMFAPIEEQIEQQEASQENPFAITTMMFGSGQARQQGRPPESSGQPVRQTTPHPTDYFASFPYYDFDDGNGPPPKHLHTFGLNCFVHPCYGVCQFRSSFDIRESDESLFNFLENRSDQTRTTPEQSSCPYLANERGYHYLSHSGPQKSAQPKQADLVKTLSFLIPIEIKRNFDPFSESEAHGMGMGGNPADSRNPSGLMRAAVASVTAPDWQLTCDVIVVGEDDQLKPCGAVCNNPKALSSHKTRAHTRQKTCDVTVGWEYGQPVPCGMVCKNANTLWDHKIRVHTGQQTCDTTVIEENGQQRPCGRICENVKALSCHKSKAHSGQKICNVKVFGKNGQQQPCGTVCKNAGELSDHKIRIHSVQKTCEVIEVGENGQQRRCGKVCKNAKALSNHKKNTHIGRHTCDATMIGEDGHQRPCGRAFISNKSLSAHKSKVHSGAKTCDLIVVGENGRQQSCRTVCQNALALMNHKKKTHQKRKHNNVDQNGELRLKTGKANK
ncbi:hypothetical protein [Endozoicomonas sp. ISHI1]|uniref:hypothetical protein n=1 Tax=Endozoicomonas sp. ISHI1 TaxID=2825882 RepID=UPI0021494E9A|nr:hypothetical protein [Endozoicomonas sp. ISHI1]